VSYLIDTNIISEVRKGEACDRHVAAWYAAVEEDALFLSVVTLGEFRRGVARLRPRDPRHAEALDRWLAEIRRAFGTRILPVDQAVADVWGQMSVQRAVPMIDGLLAATARVHDLTLANGNLQDVEGLGAQVVNPLERPPGP